MKRTNTFTITTISIGITVMAFLGLVTYNMRDVLFGAPLKVQTTADGATLSGTFMPISGKALHAKMLSINGREVAVDRLGNFNDGILLSPGYNIVEVALKDKFGKEKRTTYHWVVQPATTVATNNPPYSY